MGKMKTEFELKLDIRAQGLGLMGAAKIVASGKPYLYMNISSGYPAKTIPKQGISAEIENKDLERFAVNILKALKSKRLKP